MPKATRADNDFTNILETHWKKLQNFLLLKGFFCSISSFGTTVFILQDTCVRMDIDTLPATSSTTSPALNKNDKTVPFKCSNCSFSVDCCYGPLSFDSSSYQEEVYYLRDPFEPPSITKLPKDYSVDDFVVVGSNCFMCSQAVCIEEDCSLFYKHYYCLKCVNRRNTAFPENF
uniref:Cysteine-rich DPF motif domain-containing protein 1 n=1 Tax=Ditylenchus dipsaci TaxID=166011 RepID=A0A915DQC8_9BILA